jgi:hypothetical protein
MERPPFLAMPYPLDEYLDELAGDHGKVARRLLRAARWTAGEVDGIRLDAGEALIDERSEKLWGSLRLDRGAVSIDARRALVGRVLERLEADGIIERRAAQGSGPGTGPKNGPRRGPIPTVVRFLKYREILWPALLGSAQQSAQGPAQDSAQRSGPIPPEVLPDPPVPLLLASARRTAVALGPLGERFREFLEDGLGSGLVIAAPGREQETADELETLLGDESGLERAKRIATGTCRSRDSEPRSLAWFVTVLRRAPRAAAATAALSPFWSAGGEP